MVQLFGGAIQCAVPARLIDVSDFRQVPDNQEVFADDTESLIVEILERVDAPDDQVAAVVLSDLAAANEAVESRMDSCARLPDAATPRLPPGTPAFLATARQRVPKDGALHAITILIAIIRLAHVGADLVLSFNTPGAAGGQLDPVLASLAIHDYGLFVTHDDDVVHETST